MSSRRIIKEPVKETTPLLSPTDPHDPHAPPAGSASVIVADPPPKQPRNGSIPIVVLTVFFQSIGFTITLPSMYNFTLELGVSKSFYGYIVAIYSVGQFLGSPVFGYWSNHAPQRLVIVASLFVSAIGNTLYGFVGNLPHPEWMMLLSRFCVGFGAGNVAVCRAYASEASNITNRAGTMALMSLAQGMGFVVGPILGTVMAHMDFHVGHIPVNQYTSPGFISAVFGIANTIFAGIVFVELSNRKVVKKGEEDVDKPTRAELIPIFVSIFLFFVVIAVFSVFEAMLTPITQHYYGWNVYQNGKLFTAVGILSVVVFAIISTPPMKRLDDRKMMILGTILQIIGLAVAAQYNWPKRWEATLPKAQFFAAAAIIGTGYPITSAYMFAIYSKVLNPSYQGTKMGWLTAGGSLARMLGPIWATKAFDYKLDSANPPGGELLFLGTDFLVFISLIVLIIFYRQLAPHPAYLQAAVKVDNNNDSSVGVNEGDRNPLLASPQKSLNA